jgi:hypothetical protein
MVTNPKNGNPLVGAQRVLNGLRRGQAFSRSVDLAPRPSPHPPSAISKLDRRHAGRLRKKDNLPKGQGGEGVGRGAES